MGKSSSSSADRLVDACKEFAQQTKIKREHEAVAKEIGSRLKELEGEILKLRESLGLEDLPRFEGLGKPTISVQCSAKVVDDEGFLKWLDDEGFGDLAPRTCNAQKLKSFCKERLVEGDAMPTGVESFLFEKVTLRK